MYLCFNARALGLNLSPKESLDLAAEAGFDGLDVPLRDVLDAGLDAASFRRQMEDRGLRPGAFPLPVDWRGDHEILVRDLRRLPRLADLALELGLKATGTWVLPCLPAAAPTQGPEDWLDWHVDRLGSIAKVLADRGIGLGLEVIGVRSSRPEGSTPFLHRLTDLGPLLDRLAAETPNVGVLIDAFHLFAAGEDVDATVDRWGHRVLWVHVADVREGEDDDRGSIVDHRRGLPRVGGPVPCGHLLGRLEARGYDGPVTVEPFRDRGDPEPVDARAWARDAAEAARRIWPESSRAVREGVDHPGVSAS